MNDFGLPRNFITVLAALVLTLMMSLVPHASALAEDGAADAVVVIITPHSQTLPDDPVLLRALLSETHRDALKQRQLDDAMDGVYEEMADATPAPAPAQGKSFKQSVNELLGVKPNTAQTSSHG